jgi:hypothetical protein
VWIFVHIFRTVGRKERKYMGSLFYAALWRQFKTAIDGLESAMLACPSTLWTQRLWPEKHSVSYLPKELGEFWYTAYHAIFWFDLYLSGRPEEEFTPPTPFIWTEVALANVPLLQVSTDPYTNSTSQHKTEVEPDTFSFGSTIVSAFQVGRFNDGGSSNIGWATSTNGGTSWSKGFLPGITKFQGGSYDRVSDASVAYDAKHNVWLVSSLPILETPSVHGAAVVSNRSIDGA